MHFTTNTKFSEIFNEPLFKGWRYMLDFRREENGDWLDKLTPEEFQKENPVWNAKRIAEGFSYLYKKCCERQVFYSIWGNEELERDAAKRLTGIAAFLLPKKSKFAVICPGGGYGAVCSMLEGYPLAKELNEMGYAAFVLSYRVGKNAVQPNPQEDLATAVRFILQHASEFQVDTEDYAVIGFSAGAHLAGSYGISDIGYEKYHLPKPGVLFLGYPVVSMSEMAHAGSRENFFGKKDADNQALREKYSIEKHINSEYPKTFLWQCDGDDVVPFTNSMLLAKALEEKGVPYHYEIFHYPTHGLGENADEYAKNWLERAVRCWEE